MELEQMQTLWNELSAKVNQQTIVTDKLIITMTQERYKKRFSKIKAYETAASFFALALAFLVILNLRKLDTPYLLTCGIFTIAHLVLLPPVVLHSLSRISNIGIANKNYKETVLAFAKAKQWLLLVQRAAMYLNFVLMLAVIPVAIKLLNNKDIFKMNSNIWFWFIPVMAVVLIIFSRWGYKLYQRNANAGELLIKELEHNN